ncbi:winged helix-turn-helix transcriptional regulator [Kribbella pittospori]|nr:helix-turn-helix domain-containing protein [Kribbella pittospori]
MAKYGQFCAVARALEVLGERWTLLIVRELLVGARTFTEIRRGLPRLPRATLSARLRELSKAGLVESTQDGHELTPTGAALAPVIRELARWTTLEHGVPLDSDHLDTNALTWDMQRRVDTDSLPTRTVVLAMDFVDRKPSDKYFWLHLSRSEVNLCREDTGAPVNIWIQAPTEPVTRWWLGELTWLQLRRRQDVSIHGDQRLISQAQRWFMRYLFTPDSLM